MEDININFLEDKVVNIPSHCSTELDFFKLIFTDELFENIAKGTNDYVDLWKIIGRTNGDWKRRIF